MGIKVKRTVFGYENFRYYSNGATCWFATRSERDRARREVISAADADGLSGAKNAFPPVKFGAPKNAGPWRTDRLIRLLDEIHEHNGSYCERNG